MRRLRRFYSLLRPGDPPNEEVARALFERLFFNEKRYDLAEVGRYKMNRRLELDVDPKTTTLTPADFLAIINEMISMFLGHSDIDDIDHFGNRRIRSVGELLANQFSVGLSRMARIIKERMNLADKEKPMSPADLVNARTVSAVIQSFFGSSQLSQFMDQTNPLERVDAQAAPVRARDLAVCTATAPASRCATSTTRTMAACARSRRRKGRTSA
jgi:DNA-directed RNA polymerase subunit beta